jgi:host factor-I protein
MGRTSFSRNSNPQQEGDYGCRDPISLTALKRAGGVILRQEQEIARTEHSNLQDLFLKHLRDHRVEVTIFLANGIRLQGQIRSFDNFTVQLVRGTGTQVIYKHAISAIHPAEPIQLIDPASIV